jgi:hypothetical protein
MMSSGLNVLRQEAGNLSSDVRRRSISELYQQVFTGMTSHINGESLRDVIDSSTY